MEKSLKIILVRHYKVDIKHKSWLSSDEYTRYCNDYNTSPIIDQKPPILPNYKLYSSYMQRAKETARLATKRESVVLDGVHEVTFNGFLKGDRKLPFLLWEVLARIQWFMNSSKQKESLKMTKERISKAIDFLVKDNTDCIVVMHSIAIKVMSRELIKRGFKGKKVNYIKNGEAVIFEK